ncbi:hypothetical protein XAP6164_3040035 [Xanthomonas phaseoli pv. phaseoli]|nr:hypothetical protein XAP6164_3040035 [Xanthomonas phaseoli pv. phaseoli]
MPVARREQSSESLHGALKIAVDTRSMRRCRCPQRADAGKQSTAVRAQGARAGEDHAQHLRDLLDQLGIFFRRRIHRHRAHRKHQPGDRLGHQGRSMQLGVVGRGQANQVHAQLVFEIGQFALHCLLEGVRAHRAFAQQHVQQLVVGAQLFHEGFDRNTDDTAVGGGRALARLADDGAQRTPGQVDQGHGELVHVAELPIEAVRRDARLACHFAQAQCGQAAVRANQGQCCSDEILT